VRARERQLAGRPPENFSEGGEARHKIAKAAGMSAPSIARARAVRDAAIQRWPAKAELFSRKKDDGVAEAALIAVAGIVRERAP
jgi:hypothetical protein